MSFVKKAALCVSMFAATSLGVFGQNTQPQPPKQKTNPFAGTEIMVLMHSYHTDRDTPFNEDLCFGAFASKKLGSKGNFQTSIMQGAYYNSNYTITPTIGSLNEINVGRFKFGLLAGIALYPHVEKDVVKYNTVYAMEMPKNERKRGHRKTYIPTGNPYEYVEIDKTYKARGIKNKFRIIPALLATFSYNAHKGFGPFATATYVPWKSGEKNGMGIFAFGGRYSPQPE